MGLSIHSLELLPKAKPRDNESLMGGVMVIITASEFLPQCRDSSPQSHPPPPLLSPGTDIDNNQTKCSAARIDNFQSIGFLPTSSIVGLALAPLTAASTT